MDIPQYLDHQKNQWEQWLGEGFFARHETFCLRYGWLKKGFKVF